MATPSSPATRSPAGSKARREALDRSSTSDLHGRSQATLPSPAYAAATAAIQPQFTVFVRLPFPRNGFIDPPSVDWDISKERALWKILSQASGGSGIDWSHLASHFDVSLHFLLQQAAWLYERQLSQVRAQMRMVGISSPSSISSPVPESDMGSATTGTSTMKRVPSSGAPVRSLQQVRLAEGPRQADGGQLQLRTRITGPVMSRAPSTTTIQSESQNLNSSPSVRATMLSPSGATTVARNSPSRSHRRGKSVASSPEPEDASVSSSSGDSDSEMVDVSRQAFKRAPPFLKSRARSKMNDGDDEDEDEVPAFLPVVQYTASDPEANQNHTPVRDGTRGDGSHARVPSSMATQSSQGMRRTLAEHSPASSASSQAALAPEPAPSPRPLGALSPRRAAELAGTSPRRRATGRPGSDGTPSMGSSFSDLDDASVTQSALEEALLSNMQAGGMASRMSNLSQALRSRYL